VEKVQICIVYNDWNMLKSLSSVLNCEKDFTVAGAFASVEKAFVCMKWHKVDVLIVDMELPGDAATRLITQASALSQSVLPIAYGISDDQQQAFAALRAGAYGYVLKGAEEEDVVDHVRQLLRGGSPMSPVVARKIISSFWRNRMVANRELLSLREKEVLQAIADGMTYQEVGEKMGRSPHTIHSHIKNIYAKLHVSSRRHALSKARLLGIITTPEIPRTAS